MKSWNEIRRAATVFSKRWKGAYDEKSQAQSFLKEFFEVFGVDTVTQATFEHRVKFSDGSQGFVDCFWPSTILVEMKSKGKDLDALVDKAYGKKFANDAERGDASFGTMRAYEVMERDSQGGDRFLQAVEGRV